MSGLLFVPAILGLVEEKLARFEVHNVGNILARSFACKPDQETTFETTETGKSSAVFNMYIINAGEAA